jgi:hypothetical protein
MAEKMIMDKTERFVKSSEDELIDVMREHVKYMRPDSFYDQLNRGGKLTIIALVLIANFIIMLVAAFGGLV